jgi:hypothetical protein
VDPYIVLRQQRFQESGIAHAQRFFVLRIERDQGGNGQARRGRPASGSIAASEINI